MEVKAYNTDFIACHTVNGLSSKAQKALEKLQGELCEDANDIIRALIKDYDHFVKDAIRDGGRGHYLSGYDGEENEQDYNGVTYFIYRTN